MVLGQTLQRIKAYVGRSNFYPLTEDDVRQLSSIPQTRRLALLIHNDLERRRLMTYLTLRNGRVRFESMHPFRLKEIQFERDDEYSSILQIEAPYLFLFYGFGDRVTAYEAEIVWNLLLHRQPEKFHNIILIRQRTVGFLDRLKDLGYTVYGSEETTPEIPLENRSPSSGVGHVTSEPPRQISGTPAEDF